VGDAVVGVAEVVDRDPLVDRHAGHRFGLDRHDRDVLVPDVVVVDVRA
jgi:hypothetical protein